MTWDGDATATREMRAWKHGADADERPARAVEGARHTALVEAGRHRDLSLPSAAVVAAQIVEMRRNPPAVVHDLAALRAAVARLEAETERADELLADMAETLARTQAARDAARAALAGLIEDMAHFAQTEHQAIHGMEAATWRECDRGVCPGIRRAVARARAATGAGDGHH